MAVGVLLPWSFLSGSSGEANQKPAKPYSIGVLPFARYSADKGFGGGFVLQYDDKRNPEYQPYYLSHRLSLERTTRGIAEYKYRLDSKYLLPANLRLTLEMRYMRSLFEPYHGPGGAQTRFDDTYIDKAAPTYRGRFYYMYDKRYMQLKIVVQGRFQGDRLRWLAGMQLLSTNVDSIDYDDYDSDDPGGQSLLARHWEYYGSKVDGGQENGPLVGFVWDSRDHEATPRKGIWSEALLRWVPKWLGSDFSYAALTATHRQYVPLSPDLTLALRLCVRYMTDGAPFFTKPLIDGSFSAETGLGGDRTVRGLLWQRVVGQNFIYSNLELRYYIRPMFRTGYVAASAFFDLGRTFDDSPDGLTDNGSESDRWHQGFGTGARLVFNDTFIVALDLGWARDPQLDGPGVRIYSGLDWLF